MYIIFTCGSTLFFLKDSVTRDLSLHDTNRTFYFHDTVK